MNILDKICADKRRHIRDREEQAPLEELEDKIAVLPPPRGFRSRLENTDGPALIAEIKKASPSGGLIRNPFDPAALARDYEAAGAACLSVLTDAPHFQGRDEDLGTARNACALPALRKDFMLEPYQIYESRALGADCVLLIMAALEDDDAAALYDCARALDMDVLVEVHDRAELRRALALNAAMIGVNSRNLKTLQVDLRTALDLVHDLPDDIVRVAESGIKTSDDLRRLQDAGYNAFLVGESLMRQGDIQEAVRALLGRT